METPKDRFNLRVYQETIAALRSAKTIYTYATLSKAVGHSIKEIATALGWAKGRGLEDFERKTIGRICYLRAKGSDTPFPKPNQILPKKNNKSLRDCPPDEKPLSREEYRRKWKAAWGDRSLHQQVLDLKIRKLDLDHGI